MRREENDPDHRVKPLFDIHGLNGLGLTRRDALSLFCFMIDLVVEENFGELQYTGVAERIMTEGEFVRLVLGQVRNFLLAQFRFSLAAHTGIYGAVAQPLSSESQVQGSILDMMH